MLSEPELKDIIIRSGLAEFTRHIKLGKFGKSYDVAEKTIDILTSLVKNNPWPSVASLLEALRKICDHLDSSELDESAVGNMTRRVMKIIRDECHNIKKDMQTSQSIQTDDESSNFLNDEVSTYDIPLDDKSDLKDNILEAIEKELQNELELGARIIRAKSVDYIYSSDKIILTLGKSRIVENFLTYAASSKGGDKKFVVAVVSLAPFYSGNEMAKNLNKHNIETIIIPDSAVFAIMSRVNKVILGTHSMMANGGLKAPAGAHSIALAAEHYSVPLLVCCPLFKLTPSYLVSHDAKAFKQFSGLHSTVPEPYTSSQVSDEGDKSKKVPSSFVESVLSTFDYVPPELITSIVSNTERNSPSYIGGDSPSDVYQLLDKFYCKSDYLKCFR